MRIVRDLLQRTAFSIAIFVSLPGCDDDAIDSGGDASASGGDSAVADVGTRNGNPPSADADLHGDALPTATPDAAVSTDDFSWRIDPMEILLQRGTCRTVQVHVQRRNGYNGPILLGVGGGAMKVGFSSNHIAAGESTGAFVLTTAANAPAVTAEPLIVAASGNKTYLRLTVLVTVADTPPVTDGGVLEPAGVDGSVFDEATCRQISEALGK
jgi:hypothetical protein